MKKFLILILVCLLINTFAFAEIKTATTDVYVRDINSGEIVGSLYAGDSVEVIDSSKGWLKINVDGKEYKVWGEYFSDTQNPDDTEISSSLRKSKSSISGVTNMKKYSLSKNNELYGLGEVLWG